MLKLNLTAEVEEILGRMSADTGQSAETIAYRALLEHLEDWEDLKSVEEALKDEPLVAIPLEEVMRKYGMSPEAKRAMTKPAAE
ncbi:hypothetical protein ACSBOB_14180 [Mesorhizobium sp. ASY16-5R]|jgi:hypothetical protein|uniref:hypothetical protein n=1 Tax=Mesorhizobium sp. ASY16-5R TaxID=3445772 RepID=UPI003FA094AE